MLGTIPSAHFFSPVGLVDLHQDKQYVFSHHHVRRFDYSTVLAFLHLSKDSSGGMPSVESIQRNKNPWRQTADTQTQLQPHAGTV